jgi:hypothetical protein
METSGLDISLSRGVLEAMFVRVYGTSERGRAHGLNKRQLCEALLYKVAPSFDVEGRSDAALEGALTYLIESAPAPKSPTPLPATDAEHRHQLIAQFGAAEAQRRAVWQQPMSGASAPPRLDLEAARVADASTSVRRTDGTSARDFAAELAELEQRRRDAWRTPRGITADASDPPPRAARTDADYATRDFAAELAELDAKRRAAATPKVRTAAEVLAEARRR